MGPETEKLCWSFSSRHYGALSHMAGGIYTYMTKYLKCNNATQVRWLRTTALLLGGCLHRRLLLAAAPAQAAKPRLEALPCRGRVVLLLRWRHLGGVAARGGAGCRLARVRVAQRLLDALSRLQAPGQVDGGQAQRVRDSCDWP